jgi:HlyD family secretion protein
MDLKLSKGKKNRSNRKKFLWYGLVAVLVILGGSTWFFTKGTAFQANAASATPSYYTTAVRQGSIRVSASGAGTLIASAEADLSFPAAGVVGELNVKAGDQVTSGEVLAKLKDLDTLNAAISTAELALVQAQNDLASLQDNAAVSLATAYKTWVDAQETYADALFDEERTDYARCSKETNTNLVVQVERLSNDLAKSYHGSDEWINLKSEYDTAYANMVYCLGYTPEEKTNASATVQVAETQMNQAKETYDLLEANKGIDPTELAEKQNAVSQAEDDLAVAQQNLEAAIMVAPMDGTVISVAAGEGENVDTSTFITIADLSQPAVTVSVDETDIDKLKIGNKAEIVFDALPDRTFTGEVSQVNPSLTSSGQSQVATGTIQLDPIENLDTQLMLGLNASVEVIESEADDILLVPVEALRDLGNGEYAVFVVDNGQLKLQVVETGLSDGTYAEISSGLSQGELVSTGITQIK